VGLKVSDKVMLSVQPKFRLDCHFKGPFMIESLTETNTVIHANGERDGES